MHPAIPDKSAQTALAVLYNDQANGVQLTSPEHAQWCIDRASQGAKAAKQLREEKAHLLAPLKEAVSRIEAVYNPAIKAFSDGAKTLKQKAHAFTQAAKATAAIAMQHAQSHEDIQRVQRMTAAPEGMHERVSWGYEVIDYNQIPREYWILDDARLKKEARACKEKMNVPGIRPVKHSTPVLR